MDGKVTDASDLVTEGEKSTKSLVVYFSRMGEIPGELDAVSSATVSSNSQLSGSDSDAQAAAKMVQTCIKSKLTAITANPLWELPPEHGLKTPLICALPLQQNQRIWISMIPSM